MTDLERLEKKVDLILAHLGLHVSKKGEDHGRADALLIADWARRQG